MTLHISESEVRAVLTMPILGLSKKSRASRRTEKSSFILAAVFELPGGVFSMKGCVISPPDMWR